MFFIFKPDIQKIYKLHLSTETRPDKGQWLKEQPNILKLRMFRVGTRRPAVSKTEEQHLEPLKSFTNDRASE
jgi:hypothetical protein